MEYIVHYPCGLGLKDIVGMGNTALVGRLDAVVKFADRKELKALEIEKRVYQRLGRDCDEVLRYYGGMENAIILQYACNGSICNNIFLDENLDARLGDFAGSSIDGETPLICYETSHEHPEMAGISIKSEVFAVGSTLYEIMTGSKPYKELSDQQIRNAYRQGNFLMFQEGTQDTCRISWMIPLQALYHLDLGLVLHRSSGTHSFWLSHIHPILALI